LSTNHLSYVSTATVTDKKSFIILTLGGVSAEVSMSKLEMFKGLEKPLAQIRADYRQALLRCHGSEFKEVKDFDSLV
jgi:hypothetical protein